MVVGRYDVYSAWLELFVLVDRDDGYRGAAGKYFSQVARTGRVEVLSDYDGSGEWSWEGRDQRRKRLYPTRR